MLSRKENIIQVKTAAYAARIVKLYQYLLDVKNEQTLSKQILRSGTSIGANTAESRNAQSKADFISKLTTLLTPEIYTKCKSGCLRLAEDFDRKKLANGMYKVIVSSDKGKL